ncbi:hypothetical protein RCL1_002005 [Eukaryota sp. TZLM3-RCL]
MVEMTPELLRQLCRKHKLYTTPDLNDTLYLHYQSFSSIKNLEPYCNLKTLWLEGNGLKSLEGLEAQSNLRCLYVQENCLDTIDHLSHMTQLDQLNLNNNLIKTIENLSCLTSLHTLYLKKNFISTVDDIVHLVECPSISVLDLSENSLENPEVIDVFAKMPELRVLYLQGNPLVKHIQNYRKIVISKLPKLTYLDDRPVFESERLLVEAWVKGGREGEQIERERQFEDKRMKEKRNLDAFREMFVKNRTENVDSNDESGDEEMPDLEEIGEEEVKREKVPVRNVTKIDTSSVPFVSSQATVEEVEEQVDEDDSSVFLTEMGKLHM